MQQFDRKIRSFVRREGRITALQQKAYDSLLPEFGIEYAVSNIDFAQIFNNTQPVTLEIGFGMGKSLAQQAVNHPHINFLGIEVHRPGVGALLALVQQQSIKNIRVICHDAIAVIENMINHQSLDKVQLFFPDPWHKKRHHKRRIVNAHFAELLQTKLKHQGILHMATDWENYAEHMLQVMQHSPGWKNLSSNNRFVPKPDDRPITKFQKRGEKLGHGVWDLMFAKSNSMDGGMAEWSGNKPVVTEA